MASSNAGRRKEIGLEKRSRTRLKLLEAAARVIAHLGEDEATIEHFISAAGVARGTFYNYFPSRETLVAALWEHVGQDPFRVIQRISMAIQDPAERLITEARLVIENAGQDPTWGWLIWYLSQGADTLNEELRAYPMPDLVAGRLAKRFTFDDNNAARDLVVSVVRAGMKKIITEKPPPSYLESLSTMILVALGVKPAEARRIARLPIPKSTVGPQRLYPAQAPPPTHGRRIPVR